MITTMTPVGVNQEDILSILEDSKRTVVMATFKKTVSLDDLNRLYCCPRRNISMSDASWFGIVHALSAREWPRVSRKFEITIIGSPHEKRNIAAILVAVAEKIENVS